MNCTLSELARAARQRGQSIVEYTIICVFLTLCLFAAQSPVGQQLAQAIRDFYADLTYFLSLP
jgi:Flp pilus assembly pilin Flp